MTDTPRTTELARGNHVVPTEFAEDLERERDTLRDQLEAWREVAGLLAYALQAPHLSAHHPAGNAYHARGTAIEAYHRLKTNGTEPH